MGVSHARSGGMLGRQVQFWGGEGLLSNIFSPLMGFEIPFFFPSSSSSVVGLIPGGRVVVGVVGGFLPFQIWGGLPAV